MSLLNRGLDGLRRGLDRIPAHGPLSRVDRRAWREVESLADAGELVARWLEGDMETVPGYYGRPAQETEELIPALAGLNRAGFVTVGSQPGEGPVSGDGETWWWQRAFVDGVTEVRAADRADAASTGSGLLAIRHDGARRRMDYRPAVPVTATHAHLDHGRGVVATETGSRMSRSGLELAFGGYLLDELCRAQQVTVIDPVWGRNSLLWPTLTRELARDERGIGEGPDPRGGEPVRGRIELRRARDPELERMDAAFGFEAGLDDVYARAGLTRPARPDPIAAEVPVRVQLETDRRDRRSGESVERTPEESTGQAADKRTAATREVPVADQPARERAELNRWLGRESGANARLDQSWADSLGVLEPGSERAEEERAATEVSADPRIEQPVRPASTVTHLGARTDLEPSAGRVDGPARKKAGEVAARETPGNDRAELYRGDDRGEGSRADRGQEQHEPEHDTETDLACQRAGINRVELDKDCPDRFTAQRHHEALKDRTRPGRPYAPEAGPAPARTEPFEQDRPREPRDGDHASPDVPAGKQRRTRRAGEQVRGAEEKAPDSSNTAGAVNERHRDGEIPPPGAQSAEEMRLSLLSNPSPVRQAGETERTADGSDLTARWVQAMRHGEQARGMWQGAGEARCADGHLLEVYNPQGWRTRINTFTGTPLVHRDRPTLEKRYGESFIRDVRRRNDRGESLDHLADHVEQHARDRESPVERNRDELDRGRW